MTLTIEFLPELANYAGCIQENPSENPGVRQMSSIIGIFPYRCLKVLQEGGTVRVRREEGIDQDYYVDVWVPLQISACQCCGGEKSNWNDSIPIHSIQKRAELTPLVERQTLGQGPRTCISQLRNRNIGATEAMKNKLVHVRKSATNNHSLHGSECGTRMSNKSKSRACSERVHQRN